MNKEQKDIIYAFHRRINEFAQDNSDQLSYALGAASGEEIVVEDYSPIDLTIETLSIYEANPDRLDSLLENVVLPHPSNTSTMRFNGGDFGGCDCYSYTYEESNSCYWECIGEGTQGEMCYDPTADNHGDASACQYSGGGVDWQNIGNTVWGVIEDIGLDTIIGWFSQDDDDGGSPTPTPPTSEEEQGTDWGKIALIGGIVIAVGIGAYFLFRRKK